VDDDVVLLLHVNEMERWEGAGWCLKQVTLEVISHDLERLNKTMIVFKITDPIVLRVKIIHGIALQVLVGFFGRHSEKLHLMIEKERKSHGKGR